MTLFSPAANGIRNIFGGLHETLSPTFNICKCGPILVFPDYFSLSFTFYRVQRRMVNNKMNFAIVGSVETGKNWAGMGWYGFGGRGVIVTL